MSTDFRSDRSDSPEGKGRARKAWDAYAKTVNRAAMPMVEPAIRNYAARHTADLLGFWLAWHLHGGFEGMVDTGMHPSTVWRKVKRFRTVFHAHPDVFELPGVKLNVGEYWDDARRRVLAAGGEIPESLKRRPTSTSTED